MKRKICGYIARSERIGGPRVVCTLPPDHQEPHNEFKYMLQVEHARAMREGIDDETPSGAVSSTRLPE